jgi:hypothetical protein
MSLFDFWAYKLRRNALEVDAIREAILDSRYMSVNNLNARFAGTYGFSVVFNREGVIEVKREFPAFAPYLDLALDAKANAFFLNPLLVADGAGVAPHVDLSLATYCPEVQPPRRVSVLYVAVPQALEGGELCLYRGERPVAKLQPQQGALLHFRGDLRHEVLPVRAGAPTIYDARLSLVMEQYRVPDDLLPGVPRFLIGSRRAAWPAEPPLAGGVGEGAFGEVLREALEE